MRDDALMARELTHTDYMYMHFLKIRNKTDSRLNTNKQRVI